MCEFIYSPFACEFWLYAITYHVFELAFFFHFWIFTLHSHFVYSDLGLLVTLLCNIASSLGETSYVDHYLRDYPYLLQKVVSCPSSVHRVPPCLFRWLETCLRYGCHFVNDNDLPPLICKNGSSVVSLGRKIVSFYSLLLGSERIGRKLSTGVYYNIAKGSASTPEELTVLAMVAERFGLQQLDLLPAGVSLPLRHVSHFWIIFNTC